MTAVAACFARDSISVSDSVLSGCWITAGFSRSAPSAVRWTSASCRKASVTMTAVGIPRFSSSTASCKLHDVHDPQSPIAVIAMSVLSAIVSISTDSAGFEKLCLVKNCICPTETVVSNWLATCLRSFEAFHFELSRNPMRRPLSDVRLGAKAIGVTVTSPRGS